MLALSVLLNIIDDVILKYRPGYRCRALFTIIVFLVAIAGALVAVVGLWDGI